MLCLKYFIDVESLQKILTNTYFADSVTNPHATRPLEVSYVYQC